MVVRGQAANTSEMPSRVGVNLRASAYLHKGDRKYMEDEVVVAYQRTDDKKDIEYAFFGIFDGHGGKEAAHFAKDHLMDNIVSQRAFWSDDDDDVLDAIREGFIQTHMAMWKVLEKWPRTASGWPSTSGSTASVAFIRKQKIYIGHVGDSGICLGFESDGQWMGEYLTKDHKPEDNQEKSRITRCGGKVVNKSGVPRVVWNRPKRGHMGPVRRSTPMDEIPFLAVARSLGDLWSYNPTNNQFVVSPVPDVHVYPIDISRHRCLIFGTDGLWNVMSQFMAVNIAYNTEKNNESHYLGIVMPCGTQRLWVNPSRSVVKCALERYSRFSVRADNTSALVVFLDPPGKPKREVLLQRKGLANSKSLGSPTGTNSTTTTSNNSAVVHSDSKVQVHVYNLENKHSKSSCPKTPYGVLRIKERLPEKWQTKPADKGSSPFAAKSDDSSFGEAVPSAAGAPTTPLSPYASGQVPLTSGECEQAPTPGSCEAMTRLTESSLNVGAAPNVTLSSSLSTPTSHDRCAFPSSLLRSTLRSATPEGVVQSARLSLCASVKKLPSGGKRDRDEADFDPLQSHSKRNCTECGECGAIVQGYSLETTSMAERSNTVLTCTTCHSVLSSPKSLKRNSQDNFKCNKKGDDIQIPVISSSSTLVSSQPSRLSDSSPVVPVPVESRAISSLCSPGFERTVARLRLKKNSKHHETDRSAPLRNIKRLQSVSRRTRSGVPLSHMDSSCSPAFLNNNNAWIASSSSKTGRCVKIASEPCVASRVLKSVNRGSPSETNKSNVGMKTHKSQPILKSDATCIKPFKYSKLQNRKRQNLSLSPLQTSALDTLPPSSKKAKMHLRSDKPMITRSQEKTCKNVRPK